MGKTALRPQETFNFFLVNARLRDFPYRNTCIQSC